jgi:hypothetical protein
VAFRFAINELDHSTLSASVTNEMVSTRFNTELVKGGNHILDCLACIE